MSSYSHQPSFAFPLSSGAILISDDSPSQHRTSLPYSATVPRAPQKSYIDLTRKEIDSSHRHTKKGSNEKGTHGAHVVSHELVKGMQQHIPGPKVTAAAPQLIRALQSDENIRIKSKKGNLIHDRRNDAKILQSYADSKPLTSLGPINRATQIYKKGTSLAEATPNLKPVASRVGKMKVATGNPGRPRTVESLVNARPKTDVDLRSTAVKNKSVVIARSGSVDGRSSAVKSGAVIRKKSGGVDGRSSLVKQGGLKFISARSGKSGGGSSKPLTNRRVAGNKKR